jgi:hypothetical protein
LHTNDYPRRCTTRTDFDLDLWSTHAEDRVAVHRGHGRAVHDRDLSYNNHQFAEQIGEFRLSDQCDGIDVQFGGSSGSAVRGVLSLYGSVFIQTEADVTKNAA